MWRLLAVVATGVLMATLGGSAAAADTVVRFDPARGELPEGIAFDGSGSMFVSIAPLGEIRRLADDGIWSTVLSVDPGTTGLGVLGLAADRSGVVYAAVPSSSPSAHGVWAVGPEGPYRLAGSEQIVFPNGIAIDHDGVRYVTDSIGGAIWRIRPDAAAELWLRHESLAGLAELNPFPLGANGIAYAKGRLLVANTEKRNVVEIPLDPAGAPGTPRVLHAFGPGAYLDGVAVDVAGNVYVVVAGRNELVRLDRWGEVDVVATAEDGLNVPASVAFGIRTAGRRMLYVTNLSLPQFTPFPTPSVLAVPVPLPGPPLP
jgi:sugar lactone lactonase YvrE